MLKIKKIYEKIKNYIRKCFNCIRSFPMNIKQIFYLNKKELLNLFSFELFILLFTLFLTLPYVYGLRKITSFNYKFPITMFFVMLSVNYVLFFLYLKIIKIGRYFAALMFGLSYSIYYSSLFIYGYEMDTVIITSMLENETEMIWYYVNFKIILLFVLFIIFLFFIIKKININKKHNKYFCFISLIFVITILLSSDEKRRYIFSNPAAHFLDLINLNKINRAKEGLKYSKHIERNLTGLFDFNEEKEIDIIYVVGESVRWDFFDKYASLSKKKDVLTFKSRTNAIFTREALPEILSFNSNNKNYSIVDIFNTLGFNTHWIGAQNIRGRNDSSYSYYAMGSDIRIFKEPKRDVRDDFELLDYLDKFIKKDGKNFYIIHQMGSHAPFEKRFNKKNMEYCFCCNGEKSKECEKEPAEINYINSIIYTDLFLNKLISKFKNKKNVLFFFRSDHGTHFVFLNKDDTAFIVPSFFKFEGERLKDNFKTVQKNKLKNTEFTSNKVVESILDCVGVKSQLINKQNSLCSEEYR